MARDFNTPKDSTENLGSSLENTKLELMRVLNNFINETNLVDLDLHGSKYTWKNQ